MKLKTYDALECIIFRNCKKSNFTMMASFTSNSEQKEQTNKEKYVFYCSVSQIHINPEKTPIWLLRTYLTKNGRPFFYFNARDLKFSSHKPRSIIFMTE